MVAAGRVGGGATIRLVRYTVAKLYIVEVRGNTVSMETALW